MWGDFWLVVTSLATSPLFKFLAWVAVMCILMIPVLAIFDRKE